VAEEVSKSGSYEHSSAEVELLSAENLISLVHELLERMNRLSLYIMILSIACLFATLPAIWAGAALFVILDQPHYTYWNLPSATAILSMSAYLLFFGFCWTVVALVELQLVTKYRKRLGRLRAAENNLLQEVEGSQAVAGAS